MAIKHRGEVEIDLDGRRWTMRPTFRALDDIQRRTGKDINEIARECWEGRYSCRSMVTVIWAGIRAAHDDAPEFDEVGEIVIEGGLINFYEPVLIFLAGVVSSGHALDMTMALDTRLSQLMTGSSTDG